MVVWGADVGQLVMGWDPMETYRLIAVHRVPEKMTDFHRYSPQLLQLS